MTNFQQFLENAGLQGFTFHPKLVDLLNKQSVLPEYTGPIQNHVTFYSLVNQAKHFYKLHDGYYTVAVNYQTQQLALLVYKPKEAKVWMTTNTNIPAELHTLFIQKAYHLLPMKKLATVLSAADYGHVESFRKGIRKAFMEAQKQGYEEHYCFFVKQLQPFFTMLGEPNIYLAVLLQLSKEFKEEIISYYDEEVDAIVLETKLNIYRRIFKHALDLDYSVAEFLKLLGYDYYTTKNKKTLLHSAPQKKERQTVYEKDVELLQQYYDPTIDAVTMSSTSNVYQLFHRKARNAEMTFVDYLAAHGFSYKPHRSYNLRTEEYFKEELLHRYDALLDCVVLYSYEKLYQSLVAKAQERQQNIYEFTHDLGYKSLLYMDAKIQFKNHPNEEIRARWLTHYQTS